MSLPLKDVEKRNEIINQSFESIADRYDLLNDLLSFGLQRHWKRRFVKRIAARPNEKILDLAGGTGSIASMLHSPGVEITLLDPSKAMLKVAEKRHGNRFSLTEGFGEAMPFETETFDKICVAFGVRNAKSIPDMLSECFRVLKPSGKLFCLEFSKAHPFFAPFYHLYLNFFIPLAGGLISGDRRAYVYLAESIARFDDPETLAGKFNAAGFADVSFEGLTFGTVRIHSGRKPATME